MAQSSENPSRPSGVTFKDQLVEALERFTDPDWLGEHSPLAAPYLLGSHLLDQSNADGDYVLQRGRALQALLREAVQAVRRQDAEGARCAHILDLTYLQPLRPMLKIVERLNVSRATYYRDRDKAVERLEAALVRCLNPALRLEAPAPLAALVGRSDVIAACLQALSQRRAVALLGPGGIGKTTLGAHLAATLADQTGRPAFWFTLRPGLNDRLDSLLFALGYFLHRRGASSLWLQLIAGQGKIDAQIAPALVRHDLETLLADGGPSPLCFDEMELLHPEKVQAHAQVVGFLEGLRGLAPQLFIGQRLPIRTDVERVLVGLPLYAIDELLKRVGIELSRSDLAHLQAYTDGNPQLLHLFSALHRFGEPLAALLSLMASAPSLELLLNRIWRRLDDDERELLMALAVFRRPAPDDAWPTRQAALDRLIDRHLVRWDGQGGVALAPAFQAVLSDWLPPESKETLHLAAAAVRAIRGEYTAAAYHYVAGGQPQRAVQLWYAYREQEIGQGQGGAALALFGQLSANRLSGIERQVLVLLRSELRMLVGAYAEAEADLRATAWRPHTVLAAHARRLQGDIADQQGELDRALRAYQEGLETAEALLERELALFHKNRAWIYRRQKRLDRAVREAGLARYEVENLEGSLQVQMGDFSAAHAHYQQALLLARRLGHDEGEAKTHYNLASMLALQGKLAEAQHYSDLACRYYERIGRLTRVAGARVNLAVACNQAGRHRPAIPLAEEALALFDRLGVPYGQATAAQSLAEAHLALGELDRAEHFAYRVIDQEEAIGIPDGLRVLGEVRLAQARLSEAEQLCRQAVQVAEQNQDPFMVAYTQRSLGRVYRVQGREQEAGQALKVAIALFEDLDLPAEVEKTRAVL